MRNERIEITVEPRTPGKGVSRKLLKKMLLLNITHALSKMLSLKSKLKTAKLQTRLSL